MFNLSAAMGPKFAEIANTITEKIKQLGPNPLKSKEFWKANPKTEDESVADGKNVIIKIGM